MLTLLQSTNPDVQITADIVEGSSELSDNFRGKWKLEDIMFCSSAIVDFEKAQKSFCENRDQTEDQLFSCVYGLYLLTGETL